MRVHIGLSVSNDPLAIKFMKYAVYHWGVYIWFSLTDKQTKVHVTEAEMSELVNVTKMHDDFSQLVEDLKQDYIKNLSLRTAAGV